MRHIHKYFRIIAFIVSASMLAGMYDLPVFAVTKSELQKDADANKARLEEAESEANNIEGEREEAEEELKSAQEQLVQLLAEVEILKTDIENKNAEIAQAEVDYEEARREEERQYNTMRARIKYMYENNTNASTEYLDILFHAESLTDALNKAAYAEKLAEYDRNMLNKYIAAKEEVADRKRALEDDLSELEEEETDLIEREDELNATIEEQKATVENFSSKLAAARSEAKAYQKKIEEDNAQIAKIVAAEKEAARKKAEEEARKKKEAEEAARRNAEEEAKNSETSSDSDNDSKDSDNKSSGSGSKDVGEPVSGGTGVEIAAYAQRFIGNPYVAGGTSLTDGCDCSGFVWAVYNHFGYSLPRQSGAQGASGKAVDGMENAQPGDIFYYVGHVGIYIGNGYIVHASTPATGIKITAATYRSISSIRRIV